MNAKGFPKTKFTTKNQSLYAVWENTSSSGGATANTDCIVLNPDFGEEDLGGDVDD